jgi:hypothetical protein
LPHREFPDAHGATWEVWDVKPEHLGRTRRNPDDPEATPTPVSVELMSGWLCFQSGSDRRRFYPIPPQWHDLPDGVLRVILDVADPVRAGALSDRCPDGGDEAGNGDGAARDDGAMGQRGDEPRRGDEAMGQRGDEPVGQRGDRGDEASGP